jgi:ribosomal protein S6
MDNYELAYLVSPDLSMSDSFEIQEKLKNIITKSEGSIIKSIEPTRKLLAYPIRNKGEAFLGDLIFTVATDKLKDIKKELDSERNILRHLLLSKKISKEPKRISARRKSAKIQPKVELKEIEKKLEEILGE